MRVQVPPFALAFAVAPMQSLRKRAGALGAVAVVAALVAWMAVRHVRAARAHAAAQALAPKGGGPVLHVPHMPGSITLDGDTDDPGWTGSPGPGRTGPFLFPNGAQARPFSEVRLVWGDGYLYLCLYASDEDIENHVKQPDGPIWLEDAFRVVLTQPGVEYAIEVSPTDVVTDSMRRGGGKWDYGWSSGVHVSNEKDGTINDPHDMDEEWVIEMAVPFESIGMKGEPGESVGFAVRRCDTPKGQPRICASWGDGDARGRIVLD